MLSIIIPWKNRDEVYRSISRAVVVADELGGEVILVNYSGSLNVSRLPSSRRLRVVEVDGTRYFNKASASNVGAAYANHPLLFFCDCDILLERDVVSECSRLARAPRTFVTVAHVQEESLNSLGTTHIRCFGYHMTIKTQDDLEVQIVDFEEDTSTGLRNAPGLLFVKRDDFVRINGYGGFLHGWGWEDQDMICRLTLGLNLQREQYGTLTHLSHDDRARLSEYPAVENRWESRDRMFRTALARYDRNMFRGTWTEDVKAHSSRERAEL
ncbi:galactosyltransferase-related protein [Pseudarthrobacter sp. L1SW]|uniref:galactosyltransferase-related protein n=1 Tax=Pseudarthrobacter sp. L1SW TaxID=2851598 RepID=UPI001E4BB9BF|nr:galactosyltransferase-related protein [Pseudarthrobacter sp. L1SW]UEL30068.1 hypothetical protein KTR40_08260 [Pseudarthrobacter sp. L1SW]